MVLPQTLNFRGQPSVWHLGTAFSARTDLELFVNTAGNMVLQQVDTYVMIKYNSRVESGALMGATVPLPHSDVTVHNVIGNNTRQY